MRDTLTYIAPTPYFLYGTAWKEEQTASLVSRALEAGFRGVDTANQRKHYFEEAVGLGLLQAYERLGMTRAEVWLQSKFTHQAGQDHRLPYDPRAPMSEQVMSSLSSSLEHLHTDHLDSYVLHGPSSREGLADQDWAAWEAMEALYDAGKVKALGVSNMSAPQLELLLSACRVPPRFIQNRCFARLSWDADVRQICVTHEIVYQGFSLLTANREVWESSLVAELAQRYERSRAEIIFSFALAMQMLPLTGTSSVHHMSADLKSDAELLSADEVRSLEHIYAPVPHL